MENNRSDNECKCKPRITEEEIAKMQMENESIALRYLQDCANKTSDIFISTKIQISGILIGLLAVGLFNQEGTNTMGNQEKFFFLIAVFGLLLALSLGLLAITKKQPFWISMAKMYQANINKWSAYLRGEVTYEYTRKERTKSTGGQTHWMSNSIWSDIQTWILVISLISLGILIFLLVL